jgi:large subunit ribosomal protein L4
VSGPRPKDFSIDMPSKKLKLALRQVLKDKIENKNIFAFENIDFDKPKTKNFTGIIKNLGISDKKVLVVFDSYSENLVKSMRNLQNIRYVRAADVNAYDLIVADAVIVNQKAVEIIKNRLANN